MSSRDGLHWTRWGEAFLRPGLQPERWVNRNIRSAHAQEAKTPLGNGVEWVRSRTSTHEEDWWVRQAAVEAEASALWKKDPEAARDLLTLYTAKQAALAWESTRKAAGDLAGTKIRIQPEEIRRSDVKNARGEATLIVTIFSGKEFDASKIDIASVRLGPGYLRCDK